jgi:ABC-type sugar transport system ATPase subunit
MAISSSSASEGKSARRWRDVDPATPVGQLTVAQQQLVEVARALALRPRILVMDEPTSALSTPEQTHLLSLVRNLRGRGITILYITHRLDEVFAIADRITVLKDGRHMATVATESVTHNEIVLVMRRGRIVAQFGAAGATEEAIMSAAVAGEQSS